MSYTAALFDSLLRAQQADAAAAGAHAPQAAAPWPSPGGYAGGLPPSRAGRGSPGAAGSGMSHYTSLPHGSFEHAHAAAHAAHAHAAGLSGDGGGYGGSDDALSAYHGAGGDARLPAELDECYSVIRFQRTQAAQLRARLVSAEEHSAQVRAARGGARRRNGCRRRALPPPAPARVPLFQLRSSSRRCPRRAPTRPRRARPFPSARRPRRRRCRRRWRRRPAK